jgi:hypothetical protein
MAWCRAVAPVRPARRTSRIDHTGSDGHKFLVEIDSTQNRPLGSGYVEAESNYGPRGQFYLDLTQENENTFEYTPSGVHFLGTAFESPPSS